jgi:hypothetical protein
VDGQTVLLLWLRDIPFRPGSLSNPCGMSVRVFRSYNLIDSLRVAVVTGDDLIAKSAGRCYKKRD